jgi:hypothetical protein
MSAPKTRTLSIHRTLGEAIRSQQSKGGIVKEGAAGTTTERPWGVVAPAAERKGRGG